MFSLVSDWLRRLGVLQRLAVKITICIILHYGISILLHSVNLILLTVLLVHLILHISPSYPLKPIDHSIYHSHIYHSLTHSLQTENQFVPQILSYSPPVPSGLSTMQPDVDRT